MTFTSYIVEPLTSAVTRPGWSWRSTTDPLRTYVRPRGSRLAKSLYRSRLSHHASPQNVLAIVRPSTITGATVRPVFFDFASSRAATARRDPTVT